MLVLKLAAVSKVIFILFLSFPGVTSVVLPFVLIGDYCAIMQLSTSSFPEIPWESLSFRTTLRFRQASMTWDSRTSPVGSSPAFLRYSLFFIA